MKNWYTDAKKREGGIYLQTIYFSERLLCQLERLHIVPLTLVEAPAGYGKTTALKHALRDVPYGALRWHNAQDATVCCDWLVRQIAQKDSALAQQIFDLYHENGPLVHAKPAEESSLYLMIDNFQVIAAQFPFSVLQLLSALKGTAVHVIFLSRSFWQLPIQDLMHVCYISKKDFFLRKEDIICFAEELGISLTEKQAIHIQKETGGWAAVVSLYLQNGCEEVEWKKLSRLMEDLFWRRQEDILKKALLRLAQFETVDVEMVRALTEDIADLQQMGEWFYSLPLLYYDAEQQRYCLCALLRKFLLYRLHNASFLTQWDSYHRCGCWYREHGETKKAVAAFYKVLDYAGILSCDLTGLLFEKFDKLSYTEIAGALRRCGNLWLSGVVCVSAKKECLRDLWCGAASWHQCSLSRRFGGMEANLGLSGGPCAYLCLPAGYLSGCVHEGNGTELFCHAAAEGEQIAKAPAGGIQSAV